jgi:hypothetical protein
MEIALLAQSSEAPEHGGNMLRLYSLLLMGMVLASVAIAQDRDENRWQNVEGLRVGQKVEVTTMQLRTVHGTYLNSSEAAIRLRTPEGEVTVMREEVFRVKSQEGKRKQNILVGAVVGALSGVVLGAVADYKDDVDGSDPGSNNGKLGGSVVGAGLGAGIGSLFAGHRVIYRAKIQRP